MRFVLAVMAVTLAVGMYAPAQNRKPAWEKSADTGGQSKGEPKSTVAVKAPATGANSSSKELQKIEHEKPAGGAQGRKAHTAAPVLKADKSSNNSGINFNGKGGGGGGNRNPGSLKGRLKQKGQGKQH